MVPAHVKVEASGGISLSTIASFKGCGADFLSMGELTNEVEPLDISFLVKNAVKAELKKKNKKEICLFGKSPFCFIIRFPICTCQEYLKLVWITPGFFHACREFFAKDAARFQSWH